MLFFYLSSFVIRRSFRLSNKVSQRNFSSLFFFFTQKLAFKRETKELHSSFQLALRLLLFQLYEQLLNCQMCFFRPLPSLFPWSGRISRRSTFYTLAFCLEENWVSLEMIRKVIGNIWLASLAGLLSWENVCVSPLGDYKFQAVSFCSLYCRSGDTNTVCSRNVDQFAL